MTKKKRVYKNWGVQADEQAQCYYNFNWPKCNHKDCDYEIEDDIASYLVGFTNKQKEYKKTGGRNRDKLGVLVIKCPDCHQLYWFHTDSIYVDSIFLNLDVTPGFKKPGTQEKFLASIEEIEEEA